jgi:hypothetical protein
MASSEKKKAQHRCFLVPGIYVPVWGGLFHGSDCRDAYLLERGREIGSRFFETNGEVQGKGRSGIRGSVHMFTRQIGLSPNNISMNQGRP